MNIVIDLSKIQEILSLPAEALLFKMLLYAGWIPIVMVVLWGIWQLWIYYRQGQFAGKREYMLLAIDVPRGNEQSPKAVEQMFAHLAGAHKSQNLIEKYWQGMTQDSFSFETVSIEGYTQFVVRLERKYKDLIEAMIYAQYPDAEITEVNDYIDDLPDRFPDDKYDMWGAEFFLVKGDAYPIRTYLNFEHIFSGEFKDPSAALMELFGNLRKGEQCWYQIIVTPINQDWEAEGAKEISKIIGEEVKSKKNIVDITIDMLLNVLSFLSDIFYPSEAVTKKEEQKDTFKMFNLKPVERKALDAIQEKVSKIGFEIKIRFIYIAEKEVIDKTRVNSFVGIMKQYTMADLNAIIPDMKVTATSTHYIMKKSRLNTRKNRLMQAYKARSNWLGRVPYVLNTEELATLWHFPVEESVKAPMLQKITSRKSEAPSYLPTEEAVKEMGVEITGRKGAPEQTEKEEIFSPREAEKNSIKPEAVQTGPPSNLPIG